MKYLPSNRVETVGPMTEVIPSLPLLILTKVS